MNKNLKSYKNLKKYNFKLFKIIFMNFCYSILYFNQSEESYGYHDVYYIFFSKNNFLIA